MMKPSAPSSDESGAAAPRDDARRILDIDDGLDRIMGDRTLYFKLLLRFLHDHGGTPRQIRDAVAAGRYDIARIRSHTLKGAAGMIGAGLMYEAAAALEAALRAHAIVLEQPLQRLELTLQQLLATVSKVLNSSPDGRSIHPVSLAATPAATAPATQLLIARLSSCLREGDGAAIDLLENSATLLADSLGIAKYQAVAAAAHEFDFDGALAALQRPG
ncbi:Hpt domain-containing protein [Janthinobacterium agaricidamnosum]|uniref:Hpt domain protein n=1 Tax=Janthinobacterium agaricidamnosum NBRC 102515 = DSM 9628 TaxID=1349767 RepID=W0UWS6_9BURK|nr:Hpt domain-containing protein [Janthinobacterium agaricidamnosum]CDG80904.1 hpt domain protein [Janthinobacterium agaricidamnosum NBRC 102515 = DSM 9628]